MKFQTILFDLDGTLVDAYPGILHSLNVVLKEFGRPAADLAAVKKMVGRGVENLMQQAVGNGDIAKAIRLFQVDYDRSHLSGTLLMPGVLETLSHLQKRFVMAIASNKPPAYTRSIAKHLNIERFFAECAGPGAGILPKPDPSMLTDLIKRLKTDEAHTIYVGDMPLDAETARNAGVSVALIPGGGGTKEELQAAQPDFLVEKFSDLPAALLEDQ